MKVLLGQLPRGMCVYAAQARLQGEALPELARARRSVRIRSGD